MTRKCSSCECFLLAIFIILAIAVVVVSTLLSLGYIQGGNINGGGSDNTDGNSAERPRNGDYTAYTSNSPLGQYQYAGVAAPNKVCAQAATEILASQGSAVDAAIAALLCTAVASPQNSGLGGGFFMTIYDRSSQDAVIIDAREVAPEASTERMYLADYLPKNPSIYGGLAVGVPGEVRGMWEAHSRFGKLPWADLFTAAIDMANDGVEVTPVMYEEARELKDSGRLNDFPELKAMLMGDDDITLLGPGQIQKRPKLAKTLQTIANEGVNAFYDGSLSQDIVDDIKEYGGIITLDDLRNYVAQVRQPVTSVMKNGKLRFYGPPPPSSGAIVQFILNILDGYDLKFNTTADATQSYHRLAEAYKWGFAKRTYFGDISFVDPSVNQLVQDLTSSTYVSDIRGMLDEKLTKTLKDYTPYYAKSDAGTTHISVLAPNGDAVSVTSSINYGYGSLVKGRKTGIIFNDEMDDFSTPGTVNIWGLSPSPANFIRPGKRMQSSMSPTVVTDATTGEVALVVGASGGPRIITSTVQTALHSLWLNKDIKSAVDARRVHHQLLPPTLFMEEGVPQSVISNLQDKGHTIEFVSLDSGTFSSGGTAVQAVRRQGDKRISANSDFRLSGKGIDGY